MKRSVSLALAQRWCSAGKCQQLQRGLRAQNRPRVELLCRRYATSSNEVPTNQKHERYCSDRVRKADYLNFLCTFFLPKSTRTHNLTLLAFNVETATVKDIVTGPLHGLIRLQWWRDQIKQCYEGRMTAGHPILEPLYDTIKTCKLSQIWFVKILEQRQKDIENEGRMRSIEDLEQYAENTASSLLYLSLETHGIKDVNADHAASHIGKAIGIARLLKGTPYHLQKRTTYLPITLLAEHGISHEDLYRGEADIQKVSEVAYQVASVAKAHLEKARKLHSSVPKQALRALLPALVAEDYLLALQKQNFNLFAPILQSPMKLPLQFRLMYHAWRGTY